MIRIKTNYKNTGQAEKILILHGWGSCAKNWSHIKNSLEEKGCKVFLPDLPGFGQSPPLINAWSLDDYAAWLNDFCKKNNLSQIFLAGHSFGGAVAAKFALKHPEKIKKLFLLANSGIRKKSSQKEFFKKTARLFKFFSFLPFYLLARKIIYKIFFPKSDYLSAKNETMLKTYLKVINEDISSYFAQILVPTVIIWGDKDDITPITDAFFINKEIKGSKLEILPGAGHRIHEQSSAALIEKIIQHIK